MNWRDILDGVERGELRAASKGEDGRWRACAEVKQAILAAFKEGKLVDMGGYVDKDTLPLQSFTPERGVRLVPGGSAIRRGAFVAPSVVLMPPSYVNVGAHVGAGSLIDSHALVGSCAQIGEGVHLSAGAQIGGVLEPIGQVPVVVEDGAFIGAGAILVEGVCVGERAVIAPGVILSGGIPVFDRVENRRLDKGEPIPANSVVVSGTRPLPDSDLSLHCAIIIKRRDADTDASVAMEEALRRS